MPDVTVEQPATLDILETPGTPALSSTSDMPVIETKPDATPAPEPEAQEEAPAAPEEGKTEAESATAPEEPSASDEPKKAKGVQKRLDELTRQREEEKRRAEAAEARLDRALAALERSGAQAPAQPEVSAQEGDPEPVRPSKTDYPDPDSFEQALMDYAEQRATWTARREVARLQTQTAEQQQAEAIKQAQQAAQNAYAARIDKVKAEIPDWDDVALSPDVKVSVAMAAAILHSENGPKLQYHLGKNPQEAERISQLSPPLQLLELGKLEARLTAPAPKPTISAAPAPIKPIAGESRATSKSPEEMSMEEYAAYRNAQRQPSRPARH